MIILLWWWYYTIWVHWWLVEGYDANKKQSESEVTLEQSQQKQFMGEHDFLCLWHLISDVSKLIKSMLESSAYFNSILSRVLNQYLGSFSIGEYCQRFYSRKRDKNWFDCQFENTLIVVCWYFTLFLKVLVSNFDTAPTWDDLINNLKFKKYLLLYVLFRMNWKTNYTLWRKVLTQSQQF